MKRYEKYKDSGIKWLGEIPSTWIVSKLKWELEFLNSKRVPIEASERHGKKGIYPYYGASGIIDYVEDFIFDGTYILLGEDGANILSRSSPMAFIAEGKFWVNNHAHILNVPNGEISYFCEQIELNDFTPISTGSAQPKLTKDAVANLIVVLPPLSEQIKIVQYIRCQTNIIDQLVSKKKRLIEKLKEKRQAIITEAVTKGLDSNAKVMDSGIKWLGEIPEHWMITPVKHTASLKGRQGWKGLKAEEYVSERNFGFLSTPDIKYDKIDFTSINYITKERYIESPEIMLEIGDVLLVKDGSTLGITNIVSELPMPTTVNSSIAVLRVFDVNKLIPEYLLMLLSSDYIQTIISQFKAGQGVPHLFQKDIKNFEILIPPISEQKAIVRKINESNEIIGQTIKNLNIQIAKLKEYRQSLISEAVTGKIDVRDWEPKN